MTDPRKVYDSSLTPDELLTEVKVSLTQTSPDIDISSSVILKDGPRVYKIAIIYTFKSRNTGEIKHNSLHLKSFKKTKAGYQEKADNSLILSDENTDEIQKLYDFIFAHCDSIIPRANGDYLLVKADIYEKLETIDRAGDDLVQSILEDADQYQEFVKLGGVSLLTDILKIALKDKSAKQLSLKLESLEVDQLSQLNTIAGLTQLKSFCEVYKNNLKNSSEEFWQKILTQYFWVISQVFSYPVTLFEGKAYVGGKWINNRGGNEVDFVYKNSLSSNVVLIDIKTPTAKLLAQKYRQTYPPATELSGGISQLLNYKNKLNREYAMLIANNPDKERFDNFNPKCLLIVGTYEDEINNNDKKSAFELIRSNSKDVEIITFDELNEKVKTMISLLEN